MGATSRHEPARFIRTAAVWIASAVGAGLWLGGTGRVAMRLVALEADVAPGFSVGGTLEVVAFGAIRTSPACAKHGDCVQVGTVMKGVLKLRTFQIGAPRSRDKALRIGVTRLPPRGVPRARWQRDGYFDVWLPVLAPSAGLLRRARSRNLDDPATRRWFLSAYEREMTRTEARQTIALLAALARVTPIAIGCFCADEARCHRSRLHRLIERAAAGSRRTSARS